MSLTLPPATATLHTLPNGLEVILQEDHAHPLASVQLWVRAGSLHEEKWTGSGLAHLTEHMFFKGTEKRTAAQISQEIQERGGYVNAYTTFNRTVYWIDGVAEHIAGYLEVLADMARGSIFHADELVKEQEVIRREFAMDNDEPQSQVQRLLQTTAFREHPLRHPIIGNLEIFNQVGRDDLLGFVRRHYVPNNCIVAIAGDFDTATALKLVEDAFGTWERRPYEPVVMPVEPAQVAPRHAEKEFNTDIVRLSLGWQIHGETHPDRPALDVLGFLLGSGRSSRLNLELRERRGIVHYVGAGAWSALDRGLFCVEAECDASDLAQVEQATSQVIGKLKNGGCKQDELEKAVRATLGGILRQRTTTRGMASSLAHSWLTMGNMEYDRTFLDHITTLTRDQISDVAARYLVEGGLTRVSLHPTGSLIKPARNGAVTKREECRRFKLDNGLTVLIGEDPRLPLVSTRLQFLAGVPVETDVNAGVTQVTAQLMTKGTASRTDEQIAALLEDRGGQLISTGDAHRLVVGADVMSGDETLAAELLQDILSGPAFPEDHLTKVRKRQAATIRDEMEDPLTVALRRARREMFAGLPYARTALGTLDSLERLDTGACRQLWQDCVQANNGVLSVFGNVRSDEVMEWAQRYFGGIAPGTRSIAGNLPMTVTAPPSRHELTLSKEQGILVLGFPTVGLGHDDAVPLNLIDEACSNMGSRLFNRIREQMGLAYFVGAQTFHAMGAGAFYFYVGTAPAKLDLVEEELRKEVADLAANGLRADELARAKVAWKSSWLRQQQGTGAMADALGWDELNGRGYAHHARIPALIDAVDPLLVQAVAARYLEPEKAFTVRVHP